MPDRAPHIETRVSIRINPDILGRWNKSPRGHHSITLNVAGCWQEAAKIVEAWRGYPSPDPADGWFPCHDLISDIFCEVLADTYLVERICVERCLQRIRLPRNHCKPCCVAPLAEAMHNHIGGGYTYNRATSGGT